MKTGHVFINCPFDSEYEALFHAILFTVIACGHEPRCALEEDDAMDVRLHKIIRIIEECPLGIHDISRTELDDDHQLPRFNMPFELGLFIGASHILRRQSARRRALVLDRERFRYQKFLSDIAGQDIRSHEGDVFKAIRIVRDWLASAHPEQKQPSASAISQEFRRLKSDFKQVTAKERLHAHQLASVDLKRVYRAWIAESSLRS